jgi:hypothetical protein
MKAYEFPAKITPEGKLELPDMQLEDLPLNSVVRVIVLVEEQTDEEDEDELDSVADSLRRALHEAKMGQTKPISQLWDGIDAD